MCVCVQTFLLCKADKVFMVCVYVGQLNVNQQHHLKRQTDRQTDRRMIIFYITGLLWDWTNMMILMQVLQHLFLIGFKLHLNRIMWQTDRYVSQTWFLVRLSRSLMCWVTILSISSLSIGYWANYTQKTQRGQRSETEPDSNCDGKTKLGAVVRIE